MTTGGEKKVPWMTERMQFETAIIGWLAEVGVWDADAETTISSLDLTWLVHRFEETTGRPLDVSDEDIVRSATVRAFAAVLTRVAGSSGR